MIKNKNYDEAKRQSVSRRKVEKLGKKKPMSKVKES